MPHLHRLSYRHHLLSPITSTKKIHRHHLDASASCRRHHHHLRLLHPRRAGSHQPRASRLRSCSCPSWQASTCQLSSSSPQVSPMARRERISPEHELFLMLFIISLACGSLIALTPEKVEKPKPEEKAQPTAPVVIAPPPKPPIPDPPKPPEPQKKLKRATIIPISGAEVPPSAA